MRRKGLNVVTDINDNKKIEITSLTGQKSMEKYREGNIDTLNFFRVLLLVVPGFFLPIIQEAFFNHIRIFGVKPNLAMIFVFTFAVVMKDRDAMIFGACEGLYLDVFFGKAVGVFGLLFVLLAFLSSQLPKKFKEINVLSLAIAPGVFLLYTLSESLISRITHMLSRTGTATVLYGDFAKHLVVRIIPVTLYDLIVFAIFLFPLRYFWKISTRQKLMNKMTKGLKYLDENE